VTDRKKAPVRQHQGRTLPNNYSDPSLAPADYGNPPRLIIVLPFEGRAVLQYDVEHELDQQRLEEWIRSKPRLAEAISELVAA
jgi:hypothetical protein